MPCLQVCIKKCPNYYWNALEASIKEEGLKAANSNYKETAAFKDNRKKMICLNGNTGFAPEYVNTPIMVLIKEKKCAPYVFKSRSSKFMIVACAWDSKR